MERARGPPVTQPWRRGDFTTRFAREHPPSPPACLEPSRMGGGRGVQRAQRRARMNRTTKARRARRTEGGWGTTVRLRRVSAVARRLRRTPFAQAAPVRPLPQLRCVSLSPLLTRAQAKCAAQRQHASSVLGMSPAQRQVEAAREARVKARNSRQRRACRPEGSLLSGGSATRRAAPAGRRLDRPAL